MIYFQVFLLLLSVFLCDREAFFFPMACREGEIAEAPLTLYTHDHELPCQSHGGPGFINILSLSFNVPQEIGVVTTAGYP